MEEETVRPIMENNIQRPKENEDEQQEEYSAQEEESPVNHNNGNHKSNETISSSRSENPAATMTTADPQGVVVEVGSSGTSSPAAAAVTGSGVAGEGDATNTTITTLAARITITEDDPKLQSDMSSLTPDEIEYFLWPLFSSSRSSDLNSRGDQNGNNGSGAGDGIIQRGGNITLEELRSMNERDDDFYHAFRGLSDEEELKSQVNFKQRIIIGIGAFCWLISWGWTIMFWVLKGVSNPSCINPFDDSGEVSFSKFQETWNFCYLAWFPMSCVTFSPQFPFFGGMLLIAGGFFRMKLALFAISPLTLFGCLAGWILTILAFAYKFPPIYPLIFAFHLLLLTVGGVVVTLLIPSVTKIEAAEEEKRELRKLCQKKWEDRKAGKQQ